MDAHDRELAPVPDSGRVFQLASWAGLGDCAPSGRARLDAIARWMQDAAYSDVADAGVAEEAVWVVRRSRLIVRRWPRFGEYLTVRTFCSGIGRMWAERRTTIAPAGAAHDDLAWVEAVSLWVHLNPETRLPCPLSERELAVYAVAGERRIRSHLHHPKPPADPLCSGSWMFRATDADIADHVNNAAYWEPLEQLLLGAPEPDTIDAEIEFRAPAQPGSIVLLGDGTPRLWLLSAAGEWHASISVSDGPGASTLAAYRGD